MIEHLDTDQLVEDTDSSVGLGEKLSETVKVMERLHASDIFDTPEHSKEFLNSLSYEEFKQYISLVNGIERGVPIPKRGLVGNSLVQSENAFLGISEVEYRPPVRQHRDALMEKAFEKAKGLEDPEMAALTLGLSINAIHYFDDGNGRTSRMVYSLLSKGYDGTLEDQSYYSSILENSKGRKVVDLNPRNSGLDAKIRKEMFLGVWKGRGYREEFAKKSPTYIYDAYPDTFAGEYTPERLAVADTIDDETRLKLYETLESGGMEMMSLMATFTPDRVKEYVKTSPDGSRTYIMGANFLPTLTQEEIVAWWQTSKQAISQYVQRVIKVADRPDAPEIAAKYRPK